MIRKSLIIATAVGLAASFSSCCHTKTVDKPEAPTSQIIRLNVFYTINDTATAAEVTDIARKLVEASRTDPGCLSYDFLESATLPGEYMIIETWENDSLLTLHSQAPHFVEYVPQLKSLGEMHTQRFMID